MKINSLNKEPRNIYAVFVAGGADTGIGGTAGSVEKDFDYDQVEAALTSIEKNIANISTALSTKITVTSYSGSAQPEVEKAVDSIRTYLATMEGPLKEMKTKVDDVKAAYAKSEAGIKSALSEIISKTNIN